MRVLVVEDDPVLADGLKVGLGLSGSTVDVVLTAADARAALASTRFDAVVLDWMLPDGAGLDILTDMRRQGDATPVLLLTALDEPADRVAGLDAGADLAARRIGAKLVFANRTDTRGLRVEIRLPLTLAA